MSKNPRKHFSSKNGQHRLIVNLQTLRNESGYRTFISIYSGSRASPSKGCHKLHETREAANEEFKRLMTEALGKGWRTSR